MPSGHWPTKVGVEHLAEILTIITGIETFLKNNYNHSLYYNYNYKYCLNHKENDVVWYGTDFTKAQKVAWLWNCKRPAKIRLLSRHWSINDFSKREQPLWLRYCKRLLKTHLFPGHSPINCNSLRAWDMVLLLQQYNRMAHGTFPKFIIHKIEP